MFITMIPKLESAFFNFYLRPSRSDQQIPFEYRALPSKLRRRERATRYSGNYANQKCQFKKQFKRHLKDILGFLRNYRTDFRDLKSNSYF